MTLHEIVRAWKDAEYRSQLSDAQVALLPESPIGMIELDDTDLGNVLGAATEGITDAPTEGIRCPI